MPRPRAAGAHGRKPAWLRVQLPAPAFRATAGLLDELELHTVCDEARCPNKGECFAAGTATFLILGDVCTRACRFCAVRPRRPAGGARRDEPRRVAAAAAPRWACATWSSPASPATTCPTAAPRSSRRRRGRARGAAAATVELLVPDLGGDAGALRTVLAARPDVLGHNLETVPRLYQAVRPQAAYERSLELLRAARAARRRAGAHPPAGQDRPHGGPGRDGRRSAAVLADCAAAGVDIVTVGQYLRPAPAACLWRAT